MQELASTIVIDSVAPSQACDCASPTQNTDYVLPVVRRPFLFLLFEAESPKIDDGRQDSTPCGPDSLRCVAVSSIRLDHVGERVSERLVKLFSGLQFE